ncbi:MAG TPA: ATP-binding protein [Ktedonobacteraceae bacterium]
MAVHDGGCAHQAPTLVSCHWGAGSRKGSHLMTFLAWWTSHELIERHHGRIWFESKEGQGTTFFVALPRARGVTR